MISRLTVAGLGLAVLALTGCDLGGRGATESGRPEEPQRGPGAADDLVARMVERGRLPQLEYDCVLAGGDQDERPYGRLGVVNDRYTLILKGGGRQEGSMTLAEDRTVQWDGDLGGVDDAPNRVGGARVNTDGAVVELVFEVSPADDTGHDSVVCRAGV
ncbi:hypothetical protein [Brevundimonas sp.]|uniref:hypothetical protein n=1 Tax=Brevundimonas sp. TaxID=1871086 RepID=UPI0025CCB363|nr:hypothetical protein [Brevundimonas sp.]